jgi:hypothetical protein
MNKRSQTTYSSVTRLTMNALLVQGLLALRPTLADSLPLSPAPNPFESLTPWLLLGHSESGFFSVLVLSGLLFFELRKKLASSREIHRNS